MNSMTGVLTQAEGCFLCRVEQLWHTLPGVLFCQEQQGDLRLSLSRRTIVMIIWLNTDESLAR